MSLCLIGLLTITKSGYLGGLFIIIGHGICSSGLFLASNLIYNRTMSRRFYLNKGLINFIPRLRLLLFFLCIFNMGCPPRLNFFRELLIFVSIISY